MANLLLPIKNHTNFVHNDQIWKDHIGHEITSQRKKWPERWGYLVQEYKILNRQLMGQDVRPKSSKGSGSSTTGLKLPPIHPSQHPKGFPVTTSQQIGWKSARKECQLEIYGRYGPGPKSRGQNGILKLLKWPQEGSP
ncbi:ciliary microtubule inner protein 1-like [Saccostrea echinata]|uniref:ciliary microtubule inner protein 1-like n=1 Tax=Saccostrea echinata TaxID=191078 RepID=UPI002A8088F0|nr:ciliary microtubule inner protein 1-like [Saccostrea echinata]